MMRTTHIAQYLKLVSLDPATLILALPLLKQTFPPFTAVTNRISSQPSASLFPVRQICVTSVSPGLTGDANLAAYSLIFAGSLLPSSFSRAWHVVFQEYNPC